MTVSGKEKDPEAVVFHAGIKPFLVTLQLVTSVVLHETVVLFVGGKGLTRTGFAEKESMAGTSTEQFLFVYASPPREDINFPLVHVSVSEKLVSVQVAGETTDGDLNAVIETPFARDVPQGVVQSPPPLPGGETHAPFTNTRGAVQPPLPGGVTHNPFTNVAGAVQPPLPGGVTHNPSTNLAGATQPPTPTQDALSAGFVAEQARPSHARMPDLASLQLLAAEIQTFP